MKTKFHYSSPQLEFLPAEDRAICESYDMYSTLENYNQENFEW